MVDISLGASELHTNQIQKSILALRHCLSSTYNFFHKYSIQTAQLTRIFLLKFLLTGPSPVLWMFDIVSDDCRAVLWVTIIQRTLYLISTMRERKRGRWWNRYFLFLFHRIIFDITCHQQSILILIFISCKLVRFVCWKFPGRMRWIEALLQLLFMFWVNPPHTTHHTTSQYSETVKHCTVQIRAELSQFPRYPAGHLAESDFNTIRTVWLCSVWYSRCGIGKVKNEIVSEFCSRNVHQSVTHRYNVIRQDHQVISEINFLPTISFCCDISVSVTWCDLLCYQSWEPRSPGQLTWRCTSPVSWSRYSSLITQTVWRSRLSSTCPVWTSL